MAYRVLPHVNALKKCMGWFPEVYNAAPASLSDGAAVGEGAAPSSFPFFSLPLRLSLLVLLATVIIYARRSSQKLPPQPRPLPVIGNLSHIADKKWLFSPECKDRFSEVMYLNVAGKPTIVFNSLKSAFNILERRARNYSGRPRFIVAHEILSRGLGLALMDHGELWRRMRRAAHESLTKSAVQRYHPIQIKEATILASALLSNPEYRKEHFRRASTSTIMSILYDYPTLVSVHDKAVEDIDRNIRWSTRAASYGLFLVEFLPWMIHIPERFAKWKREAMAQSAQRSELFLGLFNNVKTDLASGGVRPSFSATLMEHRDRYRLSETEMAYLAGQLYTAGFGTTLTSLMWWTLAMVAFPEAQRRAQAQLDAVVGRARLPTFSDAPRLPYVHAIIKEVLRWRPATPLGVPHAAAEDDWYEGMFIPKGATCVVNTWQCNHDRAIFGDDADDFRPERHLDDKGELLPGPVETNLEGHVTFGFGRRVCVGRHLVNNTLFIATARILWAANLGRVRDETGTERPPDISAFEDEGVVLRPAPFDCTITPRFPEAVSILAMESESFEG